MIFAPDFTTNQDCLGKFEKWPLNAPNKIQKRALFLENRHILTPNWDSKKITCFSCFSGRTSVQHQYSSAPVPPPPPPQIFHRWRCGFQMQKLIASVYVFKFYFTFKFHSQSELVLIYQTHFEDVQCEFGVNPIHEG